MTETAPERRRRELLQLARRCGVLRRGKFLLKSGRSSDYFFNLAAVADGGDLAILGRLCAEAVAEYWPADGEAPPQVLFGPAYKGIPLVVATVLALAAMGRPLGMAYDRKEVKEHGEGGEMVGAELWQRRVVLLDDVLTAGTAIRLSAEKLRRAGAELCGVLILLDRCEPADLEVADSPQVRRALERELGVPVHALASAPDLLALQD